MQQYAVISIRTEPCCERLVVGYPDEKSLRKLIAAPSILGLGYRSRDEAQANIDCCTGTAYPWTPKLTAAWVTTTWSLVADQLPRGGSNFARALGMVSGLLQRSFAVAIVVFYSKNVLSAAVRALILI